MKSRIIFIPAILAMILPLQNLNAQGTAFTYQGRLNNGSSVANGTFDLQFALFNASSGGSQQGSLVTNSATFITNGLFTVTLDFGNQFPGAGRWLEIAVRSNGVPAFTTLSPRQPLTATPYAITASNLTGSLPAAQLSGQVTGSQVDSSTVQVRVSGTAPAGQFITGINANGTVSTAADSTDWKLAGNNVTAGNFLGSTNNQPVDIKVSNQRAVHLDPGAAGAPGIIAGSPVNYATPGLPGVVIAGGGTTNFVGTTLSNTVLSAYSSIGGGVGNLINAGSALNGINSGGLNNIQPGAGGSVIAGGEENTIQTNADSAFIGGGLQNTIYPESWGSVIAGGEGNDIWDVSPKSVIGGGFANIINSNAMESVIGGGSLNNILSLADDSVIGGGANNNINENARSSTIAGGYANVINTNSYQSTIAGGLENHIENDAINSTIGGGLANWIQESAYDSFIGGGEQNHIDASASGAVIAGGVWNNIQGSSFGSFIGGGSGNVVLSNSIYTAILGGSANTNTGDYAAIPGGLANLAGQNSFAAGYHAKAVTMGTFVWADLTEADFIATANNQFLVRASRGVGINTNNPQSALHVFGTVTATNFAGSFNGGGSGLTALNASQLASGILPSGRLSGTYSSSVNLSSSGNTIAGDGSGLTALNASQLTSGTLPSARLSGTYSSSVNLSSSGNTLAGNGSSLASLNANNITGGTLSDTRLSGNVALLSANNQTFTGTNVFNNRVGINTNTPTATLDVNGSLRVGNGTTIFNNLQAGLATMNSDSGGVETNFTFTFPKAFSSVPNVIITPRNAAVNANDAFSVTVRSVTTTTCTINIYRLDVSAGWGQHLTFNWMAWE